VSWTKGDQTQGGTTEGELNDGTQISTLTVTNPQEDTEYTCVVTSGEYSSSEPSETPLSINVYGKILIFSQTMKVVNYSQLQKIKDYFSYILPICPQLWRYQAEK